MLDPCVHEHIERISLIKGVRFSRGGLDIGDWGLAIDKRLTKSGKGRNYY